NAHRESLPLPGAPRLVPAVPGVEAAVRATIIDQAPGVEYLDEATGVPPSAFAADPGGVEAPTKRGGGPRTAQGREQARRNSTDHCLTSTTVFDEALIEEIARCTAEIVDEFQLRSAYKHRQACELGRLTAQLERCEQKLMAPETERMNRSERDGEGL